MDFIGTTLGWIFAPMEVAMNATLPYGTFVGFISFLGCAAVYTGIAIAAVALPLKLVQYNKNKAYERLLIKIDAGNPKGFTSVEQAVALGFDASASEIGQRKAIALARGIFTGISYNSREDCLDNFGDANVRLVSGTPMMIIPTDNDQSTIIPGQPDHIEFYPSMIGWQAATSDLKKAVPLYASHRPGYGCRADGKQIRLTNG